MAMQVRASTCEAVTPAINSYTPGFFQIQKMLLALAFWLFFSCAGVCLGSGQPGLLKIGLKVYAGRPLIPIKLDSVSSELYGLIDTGSAYFWVPGPQAPSSFGPYRVGVEENEYRRMHTTGSMKRKYSPTIIWGPYTKAIVTLDDESSTQKMDVGLATGSSRPVRHGVMGLSYISPDCCSQSVPCMLRKNGVIKDWSYGISLLVGAESITFGGADRSRFLGQLTHNAATVANRPIILLSSLTIGNSEPSTSGVKAQSAVLVGQDVNVRIDTGTVPTVIPQAWLTIILTQLRLHGTISKPSTGSSYMFVPSDLNQLDNIVLEYKFQNSIVKHSLKKTLVRKGTEYLLPFRATSGNDCTLGYYFLRNTYSYFDNSKGTVGFASNR